jgi:nucleoid DNA-binding protein
MATKKPGSISKGALIKAVAEANPDLSHKQVKEVLDSLSDVAYAELNRSGVFTMPGLAKFKVVKKPATKARQGINPFTKELVTFAAKPASKAVRARPIKAVKDAVR